MLAAGQELLKLLGPSVLLTHSQAGPFGWLLADACPELTKAVVALEPFGPPFSRDLSDTASVNYGLTELPLHFAPPVSSPEEIEREILPRPDDDLLDGWVPRAGRYTLPTLAGVPILLVTSEASYHAQYDHLFSEFFTRCGVSHDYVRLEDAGIHGNGHMMMLEKNNLDIADLLLRWLAERGL